MDINTATEIKSYNNIAVPAPVEIEEREKPAVAPVRGNAEPAGGRLDEKAPRSREEEEEEGEGDLQEEKARQLAADIQQRLDVVATKLDLVLDDETGTLVAKILERETGRLIRQVPTEQLLHLRAKLSEFVGLLYDGFV